MEDLKYVLPEREKNYKIFIDISIFTASIGQ
jgi:hypothetical protein